MAVSLSTSAVDDLDSDKYTCPICLEIFYKPIIISCGHTLCSNCLSSFESIKEPKCPLCRSVFNPKKKEKNKSLEKEMNSTKSTCKGCSIRMNISKLRSHLDSCNELSKLCDHKFAPMVLTSKKPPREESNRATFTCPYCGQTNLDCSGLVRHCNDNHKSSKASVVCPVCAAMPWGNPNQKSSRFIKHLNLRHQFEYDTFVDYSEDEHSMLERAMQASLQQQ